MENKIILSQLGHTWLIDIDGTIVKHNGYKIDGHDTLLPGVKDFWSSIPADDTILLLTSRKEEYREETVRFLHENDIRFDQIIFNLPYGERILINDKKPSGLNTGHCVELERDNGLNTAVVIDSTL